ncbi:strigolactones hydrolase CXE15-like [Bidens hawaiensis]|uniref:strigolactones hydrolase CXE15-like n=1 Tax=Bidens hawaiensis TaxID=980011 RepID=UPI004048F922
MASLPYIVEDLGGVIQIFSDGSIHRHKLIEPTIFFPTKRDFSVVWKDYCYDKLHDLQLRIYKPKSTNTTITNTKLPVIYYLHGGGFCVGAFARPKYHNCCLQISKTLNVIVVAPNVRLAPEHRLPAAIDDAFVALKWLQELAWNPSDVVECFDFDRLCAGADLQCTREGTTLRDGTTGGSEGQKMEEKDGLKIFQPENGPSATANKRG